MKELRAFSQLQTNIEVLLSNIVSLENMLDSKLVKLIGLLRDERMLCVKMMRGDVLESALSGINNANS